MPQSSGNNRNTSKVVLQGASDNSVAMEGGPMLFKMMDVLALVFTTGSSALSASAFARGGGLGGGLIPVSFPGRRNATPNGRSGVSSLSLPTATG